MFAKSRKRKCFQSERQNTQLARKINQRGTDPLDLVLIEEKTEPQATSGCINGLIKRRQRRRNSAKKCKNEKGVVAIDKLLKSDLLGEGTLSNQLTDDKSHVFGKI